MELRDQIYTVIDTPHFLAAWDAVSNVEGWMTKEQGAALWWAASNAISGQTRQSPANAANSAETAPSADSARIVEIGSFRGRSMSILATAAEPGVELIAIDPHAGNDRGPQQWHGTADEGQSDNDQFWQNLERVGVKERVRHIREFSQQAHDHLDGLIDVLYIDFAHGYAPALDDLQTWGARVRPDGLMAVHDCFSSVEVTLALLRSIIFSREWTYLGRTRSLAMWRRTPPTNRGPNAAAQLASLPWFAQNLAIKAAIAAKQERLARWLGSNGETWPY